jgi:hypothetical protein
MSAPVRVPDDLYREVQGAARLLGCTPGELLERAWDAYRAGPEFKGDFELAQKALQSGDVGLLADHYRERRDNRARAKVEKVDRSRSRQSS